MCYKCYNICLWVSRVLYNNNVTGQTSVSK